MNRSTRLSRAALLGAIRLYQAVRLNKPSPCRFVPSCSTYAAEAISTHGIWRGGLMALRRVGRCRPAGGRGFDPVPG